MTKCIKNMGIDAGPKMNGIQEGLQGVLMEEGIMSGEEYRILGYT